MLLVVWGGMGVPIVRVRQVAVVGQVVRRRGRPQRMVGSHVCMFLVVPVP